MLGIATVLALRPLGIDPAGLNPQFMLPQNTSDWFSNLAMVPFVAQQGLPVPVAAALFVEVWAYALMPLFASSRGAAFLGLAVAICANLETYLLAADVAICPFLQMSASGSFSTWLSVGTAPIVASDLPQIRWYNAMVPGAITVFPAGDAQALAVLISNANANSG